MAWINRDVIVWEGKRNHFHPSLRQSDGRIDAFCDFAGTGGTFAGCAYAFKEYNPNIKCYIVEPASAAVLAGRPITNPNHRIQGDGYSMPDLKFINTHHVDGYIQVTDQEAMQATRRLVRKEGIFAGFSSGANLAAALKILDGPCKDKTVVIVINDSGLKYLTTYLWE